MLCKLQRPFVYVEIRMIHCGLKTAQGLEILVGDFQMVAESLDYRSG